MLITVFTPTFNRRQLIERLYQSLIAQSYKNFEWLVIDDGSIDHTEDFFCQLTAQEQPFPIHYIKQANGGKHRAINNGIKHSHGELFFIVDSDDCLTPNAIEKIDQWVKTLDKSHKWAGISGLKGLSPQICVGQRNNMADYVDAKNTERRQFHLEGDKAEVYFTKILQQYPFPEITGENFISEEIVWNRMARDGYYLRWFNEIIYVCDYLEEGLTNDNSKDQRNPKGRLLWAKEQLASFPYDWRKRMLAIAIYYNAVKRKQSIKRTSSDLDVSQIIIILAHTLFAFYNLTQCIKGKF